MQFFSILLSFLYVVSSQNVYMFRHCVRAPQDKPFCAINGLNDYPDYAQSPLPDFGVPTMRCTTRGVRLIEHQGKSLKKYIGPDEKLRLIVDQCTRDSTTMDALLDGLEAWEQVTSRTVLPTVFNSKLISNCSKLVPDADTQTKNLQKWINSLPKLDDSYYQAMQNVLGKSTAPPLSNITSHIDSSSNNLCGKERISSYFGSAFMLEYGSGLETAWGNSNFKIPADIYKFYNITMWYQNANMEPYLLQLRFSNYVQKLIEALLNTEETTIFMGHDTDLASIGRWFDMSWSGDGGVLNSTPPGSGFSFIANAKGEIEVNFLSTTFDSDNGKLTSRPVEFPNGSNILTLDYIAEFANKIIHDCVD